MVGQLVQAAQIPGHHLERHVLAHADHVEGHQCAHRVLRIRHGRAQLLALLRRQRLEHVFEYVFGQVRREIGDLVGVELLGRRDQLLAVHALDQRLAYRIGDFEQDFAVALGLDQVPDDQAFLERQCFKHKGDIGGMQGVEPGAQLSQ